MLLYRLFRVTGVAFTLATFPGLVVSALLQDSLAQCFCVPTSRVDDPDRPHRTEHGRSGRRNAPPTSDPVPDGGRATVTRPTYATDYGQTPTYRCLLAATTVPSVVTVLLAVGLFTSAAIAVPFGSLGWWLLTWLGLAVATHAAPATEAARALWIQSERADSRLRVIGLPVAAVGRAGATLALLRLDVLVAALLYYLTAAALYPGSPTLI